MQGVVQRGFRARSRRIRLDREAPAPHARLEGGAGARLVGAQDQLDWIVRETEARDRPREPHGANRPEGGEGGIVGELATRPHGRVSGRMVAAPTGAGHRVAETRSVPACNASCSTGCREDVGKMEGRESIPWCAAATECGLAPHPVVYQTRQVPDQVVRDAILLDAA